MFSYHFLQKASELSRKEGLPRIYLSANSGARLGLAEEIKHLFRVAWKDVNDPDKGFNYLYLAPEDYKKVSAANSVHAELIEDCGESRYKLKDIIGEILMFFMIFFQTHNLILPATHLSGFFFIHVYMLCSLKYYPHCIPSIPRILTWLTLTPLGSTLVRFWRLKLMAAL